RYWQSREHPEGWAIWDPQTRRFNWNTPKLGGREFAMLHYAAGDEVSLHRNGDVMILFHYYLMRKRWQTAWLWWLKMDEAQREEAAPGLFTAFYVLAAEERSDAPPAWYMDRASSLWAAYEPLLQGVLDSFVPARLERFAEGLRRKPSLSAELQDLLVRSGG
ncbi:MAG: hypothetical protein AAGJ31_12425, partial [Verrucomicrobiota bacterium]